MNYESFSSRLKRDRFFKTKGSQMIWLKQFLCWHNWEVLGVGQFWPSCVQFHPLADSIHECKKCGYKRNWIHNSEPIRWNKNKFTKEGVLK